MKTSYLLPNSYKLIGWVFLILGSIAGVFLILVDYEISFLETNVLAIFYDPLIGDDKEYFKIIENSIADELTALAIIIGGILVGFSKEKVEDEFISKLRTDSLIWAIITNYVILALAILFVYEFDFFDVLVFNMFTPLIFFVLRFNFLKSKS